MDKIWYRNPLKSELIGRCGGNDKTEWSHRIIICAKNTLVKPDTKVVKHAAEVVGRPTIVCFNEI